MSNELCIEREPGPRPWKPSELHVHTAAMSCVLGEIIMGRIHIRSTVQHVYHSGHCKHWLLRTNAGSITPASCEVLQQRELWIAHVPIGLEQLGCLRTVLILTILYYPKTSTP